MKKTATVYALYLTMFLVIANPANSQQAKIDSGSLTFLATFDKSPAADFAKGDNKEVIAEDVSRKKFLGRTGIDGVLPYPDGKFGQGIDFRKKTKKVFCYKAEKNFPYSKDEFDASISFWMKCDLTKLPKGFIDPLQITDKKWNDSSIFVDFNDKRPADFRLGVFSDLKFWNPDNKDLNKMPPQERPMVDAGRFQFSKDKWTHVALVFEDINTDKESSSCKLYLDGKLIGDLKRKQKFTWTEKNAYIMLGIYFVGQLDDFAIFDVALDADQVRSITNATESLSSLLKN